MARSRTSSLALFPAAETAKQVITVQWQLVDVTARTQPVRSYWYSKRPALKACIDVNTESEQIKKYSRAEKEKMCGSAIQSQIRSWEVVDQQKPFCIWRAQPAAF